MLFHKTFCSIRFVAVCLQLIAITSAISIGHVAQLVHREESLGAAQILRQSSASGIAKRASGGVQPTLLVAERHNRSRTVTPQTWSALSNNGPIDFRPYAGNMTIRVTKRKNAATINLDHIYDLDLDCLYDVFNSTTLLGFIIGSQTALLNTIGVPTVVDALVGIQELTHHLAIQEMEFEFYHGQNPPGDRAPIATGCLAYTDCGQKKPGPFPTNITLSPNYWGPPEIPNITKEYQFVPPPSCEASISNGHFADVAIAFYRTLFRRLFFLPPTANLTMFAEPGLGHTPPLHKTQMWEGNNYNKLTITFAQVWDSRNQFTLGDVADMINYQLRRRLADGRLKNGARGYFLKWPTPKPLMKTQTGEFCVWYVLSGPNLCNKIFHLDPFQHPGGEWPNSRWPGERIGDHSEESGGTATA